MYCKLSEEISVAQTYFFCRLACYMFPVDEYLVCLRIDLHLRAVAVPDHVGLGEMSCILYRQQLVL